MITENLYAAMIFWMNFIDSNMKMDIVSISMENTDSLMFCIADRLTNLIFNILKLILSWVFSSLKGNHKMVCFIRFRSGITCLCCLNLFGRKINGIETTIANATVFDLFFRFFFSYEIAHKILEVCF